MNDTNKELTELQQIMDRLHLTDNFSEGINRLHWIAFINFIIDSRHGVYQKKVYVNRLISVLGVRKRTVDEYIDAAVAWDVLKLSNNVLTYNRTYVDPIDEVNHEISEMNDINTQIEGESNKSYVNRYYEGIPEEMIEMKPNKELNEVEKAMLEEMPSEEKRQVI